MSKIGTFIQQKEGYKAFIPEPFPSKDLIKWDNNLISLLSQADMAIGKLNAINELVPDVDFFNHLDYLEKSIKNFYMGLEDNTSCRENFEEVKIGLEEQPYKQQFLYLLQYLKCKER